MSRPYPFFLAYPLESPLEALGAASRVERGVEVGRHPRAAHPPRRAGRSSGRAARSCSPAGFPRSKSRPRCCPKAPCSTASCCLGPTIGRCRSPSCSGASGARPGPEDPGRGAGGPRRVRPAGAGRRGPAQRRSRSSERRRRLAALLARDALRLDASCSPRPCTRRRLGRAWCRRGATRAAGGRGGADAQAARAAATAWGGARATGGSGRSSRYAVDAVLIYAQRGQRPARRALHRLHLRRVGRRPAGAVRQGVLGTDGRGDPEGGRFVRRNTLREASARCAWSKPELVFELAFEGIQRVVTAQVGDRGALPPHRAVADGQAAGGGGYAG